MITYGFYNSIDKDRRYNAKQLSSIFDGILRDGILMSIGTAMMVTESENMTVLVGAGRAWFNHSWILNDSAYPINIPQSELLQNRIDTIVIDINSNDSVRANDIVIIKGEPSTTPAPPTLIKSIYHNQYPLCDIYVGRGVSSITQANITNRIGTTDCPFSTGILETINAGALIAQWKAQYSEWLTGTNDSFNEWFETIKNILDEEAAAKLFQMIEELKTNIPTISSRWAHFVASSSELNIMKTL